MNRPPHCRYDAAFHRWEEMRAHHQADIRIKAIEHLLFWPNDFTESELRPILEKREYPLQVKRAVELYAMMARVKNVCEPKGYGIGPACAVRRIDFEELTLEEALDLKNGIGYRLLTRSRSLGKGSEFSGLDLLTTDEKELYEKIKPYFDGRGKPTLQILAARILRDAHDTSFSDRSVPRYIDALENYKFVDDDRRRDYLINSVNSYGIHNKSVNELAQHVVAQAIAQIGPVIRQQMAQIVAQALPRIPDLLPQIGQSLVLMRETYLRQTLPLIAQAVAKIPVVLPQVELAAARAYRSVPQTLSLLAKRDFNVRQN